MMMVWTLGMQGQKPFTNTAFNGGEVLNYNTYYNWKFIWVKVGTATMQTSNSTYNGKQSLKCSLITRGNEKADKLFVLRDTILCHTTKDLVPLYYRKGAREGKRYYVDELQYVYLKGQCGILTHALHADGTRSQGGMLSKDNIYDMLSIFMRARSFSAEGWKKGHIVKFPIADAMGSKTAQLKYRGVEVVKADDGNRYRCLALSYMEPEGKKLKEIVRFYVTDDLNHIPVRLDMFLNFGSAKAFLTSMRGIRNPLTSKVN